MRASVSEITVQIGVANPFRNFLLEVMERRCKEGSTMFGTQYQRKDRYARLGSDVTAEATMDRIAHNATLMEAGDINIR